MPRRRPTSAPVIAPLLGASLLTLIAVRSVPWSEPGRWSPATPIDRSSSRALGPGYRLLLHAAGAVPTGASYVVRTEPADARMETFYHRLAVSLLPDRRDYPAAEHSLFTTPESFRDAEYLIVVGPPPKETPGELVLQDPNGSVWRRRRP